eukprot:Amastigsp_a512559_27.p4 type:complete len:140 gc:universal Amastigsp_a512559_27:1143-1562(+)
MTSHGSQNERGNHHESAKCACRDRQSQHGVHRQTATVPGHPVSPCHPELFPAGADCAGRHHRFPVYQRLADLPEVRFQFHLARRVGHRQRRVWCRDRHRGNHRQCRTRDADCGAAGLWHRAVPHGNLPGLVAPPSGHGG